MHTQKKAFLKGVGLMAGFAVVLVVLFLPIMKGQNPMEYMDNLYNSISKGSAYYIPKIKETVDSYEGDALAVTITPGDEQQAARIRGLLSSRMAAGQDEEVVVRGNLNALLVQALDDSDTMYMNEAERIVAEYGYNERLVLYDWWSALKALEYELNKQKRFDAAKLVGLVQSKAVEPSYNYYGIKARNIGDKIGIVLVSLVFYVFYTLWYGFGVMYLFEGLGMNLGH